MKKILQLIGAAVLGIVLGLAVVQVEKSVMAQKDARIDRAPASDLRNSIGAVVRLVKDGKTLCSGVVLDDNTVLTAAHCLVQEIEVMPGMVMNKELTKVEIRKADNKAMGVFARLKLIQQQIDRGILKGDFRSFQKAPYINKPGTLLKTRQKGRGYISCGFPLGANLYCQRMEYVGPAGFLLAISGRGNFIPGMSGGPTFLEDGKVVGINVSVDQEFNYISPVEEVDAQK